MVYVKKYPITSLSKVIENAFSSLFSINHKILLSCIKKIAKFDIDQYKGFGTDTALHILNEKNKLKRYYAELFKKMRNHQYLYLTYGDLITIEWMLRSHMLLLKTYKRSPQNLALYFQLELIQKQMLLFDHRLHLVYENAVELNNQYAILF